MTGHSCRNQRPCRYDLLSQWQQYRSTVLCDNCI